MTLPYSTAAFMRYEVLIRQGVVSIILLDMISGQVTVVRFEVFTAVTMKNGVFWDVTPRGSCKNRHFFAAYVGC
jgi:hypothetical protein